MKKINDLDKRMDKMLNESINFSKKPTKANLGLPTGKEVKVKKGDIVKYLDSTAKVLFVGRDGSGTGYADILSKRYGKVRKNLVDLKI